MTARIRYRDEDNNPVTGEVVTAVVKGGKTYLVILVGGRVIEKLASDIVPC